jgi:hypothetical protein
MASTGGVGPDAHTKFVLNFVTRPAPVTTLDDQATDSVRAVRSFNKATR